MNKLKIPGHTSGALNYPIYNSSSFFFDSIEAIEDVFSFKQQGYIYTRGGNPTVNQLEDIVASLEGGNSAVAFSSGMGAISSTLMGLLRPGDHLICLSIIYGTAKHFIRQMLDNYGIEISYVGAEEFGQIERYIKENTKIIFFETPCNPTLEDICIKTVRAKSRSDIKIVVDNTMLSPIFQRPLSLGADIVIHSMTKYLSGHADVLGGIAISNDRELINKIKFDSMCLLGNCLSPLSADAIMKGIKTLPLRMMAHANNTAKIIQFLENNPIVEEVLYPGKKSSQSIQSQVLGIGGVISFRVRLTEDEIREFFKKLKKTYISVSYGDEFSIIQYPLYMTHREYLENANNLYAKKLHGLIRLAVGHSNVEECIQDIDQALREVER
ncbi:MAG: aminotransferase class I/II-fold pyridoxal phosphate-dependent enzyme [Oligoflexia bacterium]|nr:aminotransferase class I/II-fold pyridoxal phosphate-dependent enzyme [Oligoflexia bacterium]